MEFKQGHHRVAQPPLKYSKQLIELIKSGPESIREFLGARVWGFELSERGRDQLAKFCQFVRMHGDGLGVAAIARAIDVHRSTVAEWRNETDQPYPVKLVNSMIGKDLRDGWKWLALHLTSGGNEQFDWIEVPEQIASFDQILEVIRQIQPTPDCLRRGLMFGLPEQELLKMRPELFAHALGMLLGDSAKHGGKQVRFTSMSMDLQLTLSEPSNKRLEEFVAMSLNSLGLKMDRVADKAPSGATRKAEKPSASFRWTSERSPLVAWMFNVCLGLDLNEKSSVNPVRMNWIFGASWNFRKRFVQGLADSDGTVREYVVEIASMPNAEFVTTLLLSLGLRTPHTLFENSRPMRTCIHKAEAMSVPIFNELVSGYRYQKLMK